MFFICSTERFFEVFTILGYSSVPMLQLITICSEGCMTGFSRVSYLENIFSRGTKTLGIKFPFNSIILCLAIEFYEYSSTYSTSLSWSWSINEFEKYPVNSKNLFISKSSSKTLHYLILSSTECLYLTSIRYFSWVCFGIQKCVATKESEWAIWLRSLGMKEILNSIK